MKEYIKLHLFFTHPAFSLVRVLIVLALLVAIFSDLESGLFPRIEFFMLSLLLIVEIFFRFHVGKVQPTLTVTKADAKTLLDACSREVITAYILYGSSEKVISHILHHKQAQFLLKKANIPLHKVLFLEIHQDQLLAYAAELVKKMQGTYITSMDLITAYLILTEETTHLMRSVALKPEQFLHILYWARLTYPHEEKPQSMRVDYSGSGIGEMLITGWTPETKKYAVDWTAYALSKPPIVIGRSKEYQSLQEVLLKGEHNNVLLIGSPGVGKESLVHALAYDSATGKLSSRLNHKKVLELLAGQLIAGITNQGDMETRLQAIIAEVSHAGHVILYIPQLQDLLGAGGYQVNLADALLPYLRDGSMPIVASMTKEQYKSYFERNPLHEVFTTVALEEPDKDTSIQMLFYKTKELEEKYHVTILYNAVMASIQYAIKYLPDDVLPGSGVQLLTDAANSVSVAFHRHPKIVSEQDVIKLIESKTHIAVGEPTGKEKDMLLHLEDLLHKRVFGQDEAVRVVAEAMRRIRTGMSSSTKPISFLFLGPTGVGKTETAKTLASVYFGDENTMLRFDMSEYSDDEGLKRLLGAGPGEGDERGELVDRVHDKPYAVILLDEFEKAHPRIHNLFLQVLDDGRLTDNKGRTVSFANAIIIATSNAGSEFIREKVQSGITVDEAFKQQLLTHLQENHLFRPELLNRFNAVVTFTPLADDQLRGVALLLLQEVSKKLSEKDIVITFDEQIIQKVLKEGVDSQFGARPLRRYIEDTVEDLVAQKLLQNEIQRGDKVLITLTDQGTFSLMKQE